jgi:hypothetical protein
VHIQHTKTIQDKEMTLIKRKKIRIIPAYTPHADHGGRAV